MCPTTPWAVSTRLLHLWDFPSKNTRVGCHSQFGTSPLFNVWFCCFLTYIKVFQEVGEVVWYSHFFKSIPQFVVIHTIKGFTFFPLPSWLLQGHLNSASQWPLLPAVARTTLSPSQKFTPLLPKVWSWGSDVVLISHNRCSTKPTTFYTWMEGHSPCHLGLPAYLLPRAMLPAPCRPFCLKRSLKSQLGVCATGDGVILAFYTLSQCWLQTESKLPSCQICLLFPPVDQTSTFSPNSSWSSNWTLFYHDLFFYWMKVKVQIEKKLGFSSH